MLKKYIVILGDGQLGKALAIQMEKRAILLARKDIDLSNLSSLNVALHMALDPIDISCIINCMAYTNVDKAESEQDLCEIVNAKSLEILGSYCKNRELPLIHFSTDFVFDGKKDEMYTEDDLPNPINHYGLTKYNGEKILQQVHDKLFIFRIVWVYSMYSNTNFVYKIMDAMTKFPELKVANDQFGNLCNTFDLSKIIDTLCTTIIPKMDTNDSRYGLYHISPIGFESRYDISSRILNILMSTTNNLSIATKAIIPVLTSDLKSVAQRPLNCMLSSKKFIDQFNLPMPDWKFSLHNAVQKIAHRMHEKS